MNLTVFNVKNLKRQHLNFLIVSGIIILLSMVLVGMDLVPEHVKKTYKWINKSFFFLLVVLSIVWSGLIKKKLNKIKAIEEKEQKIEEYEKFYKNRMWSSTITFIIIAISWVFTQGNYMLYFLILLLVLQVATYPRKIFISKELMDEDIIIE